MDPNAALRAWRDGYHDAFEDLRRWIRSGGFHPKGLTAAEKRKLGIESTKGLRTEKVRIDRQGYDSRGKYWGTGAPLYRVYSEDGSLDTHIRAKTAKEAKQIAATSLSASGYRTSFRNPIRHFPKTKRGRPPASRKWDMTALDANGNQLARKTLTASKRDAYKSASGMVGKRYGKSAVAKVLLDGPK